MKIILVIAVILIGIWLFRANRRDDQRTNAKARPPKTALSPQDMVRCQLCDLHLPMADSTQGQRGSYCCPEHLKRAEP